MADTVDDRTGQSVELEEPTDEVVTGAVRRRALVPSERQLQLGAVEEDYDFTDLTAAQEAPPPRSPPRNMGGRRRLLGDLAADLNPNTLGGPKLPVLLLGLSALLASWDDVALRILLPEMRADFGFSLQFLLTLGGVLGVIAILLSPVMGYLADRVKRVWMLRLGALLANSASVIQGVAQGIPQLVLGRAVAGAGGALTEPAGFPLLSDYYPSRSRARVFAFLGFMGGLGGVVAPSVAGNLGELFGWRVAVVSLGLLATVVTIAYFFLKEPPRGYQDRKEMGADERTSRRQQEPVSWSEGWRASASIATVRRLWYATPFLQVAWIGMPLFLSLYFAEEFGLSPRERGYVSTVHGVVALAGVVVAAPVADRLLAQRPGRVMNALGALMLLYAGSVLLLVVSNNLWLAVGAGLPLGFGFVAIGPALFTLLSLTIPARIRGIGLQTIAPWQLMGMAALPFVGRAADTWGIRQGLLVFIPFYVVGALILGTSSQAVARDIRAARAASMAEEEVRRARDRRHAKMLICRDVDVSYEGAQVISNLDFDVEQGEVVALLGTNGAGKSTLLRAIAGVHEASNGAIFFDGRDVTHAPAHQNAARGITMVPGGKGVFPALSVKENLRIAAWLHRKDKDYARKGTERALQLFPVLRERSNQRAGLLSGGEQQMLALAQAFLSRPNLLMIDELSLGLAPSVVDQLLTALRQINSQGTTIIIVEQSLGTALRLAQRAVFMEKGQIRFDGPTEELLSRPDLVRSVFMGGAASASGRLAVGRADPAKPQGTILRVNGLRVRFEGVEALRGVDLEVRRGEVVGLIGPNGAGKTTLFNAISGFVPAQAGRVFLGGRSIEGLRPDARSRLGLGRSFQDVRLFPSLTVRENVAVARERRVGPRNPVLAAVWASSVRRAEAQTFQRVDALLNLLGLRDMADKFVDELSTGTRRALEIACVAVSQPDLVLLDEPSSGLAQAEVTDLGFFLARTAKEAGWAMLIIEHDLSLITALSDRLVAMDLGAVLASGPPDEVLTDPRVVDSYLGGSGHHVVAGSRDLDSVVRQALGSGPAPASTEDDGRPW